MTRPYFGMRGGLLVAGEECPQGDGYGYRETHSFRDYWNPQLLSSLLAQT
jgi:hypothetical protein